MVPWPLLPTRTPFFSQSCTVNSLVTRGQLLYPCYPFYSPIRSGFYSKPMPFALQDRNPIQIPHAAFRAGPWLGLLVRCCVHWLHVSMALLGLLAPMASRLGYVAVITS